MPRFLRLWLIFCVALLSEKEGFAQIVNIQEALSGHIPTGINLQLDLSQSKMKGNVEAENFSANAMVTFRSRRHLVLLMSKRDYGQAFGDRSSDSHFNHLRYAFSFTRQFSWEAFGQDDADKFRRNARRILLGTGPRFQTNIGRDLTLATSIAYMTERESFSSVEVPGALFVDETTMEIGQEESTFINDPDRNNKRYSIMGYVNYFFKDYIGLNFTVYNQPKIGESSNYKALYEGSLLIGVNDNVSVRISYNQTHNSHPPFGIEPTDTTIDQSININYHVKLSTLSGPSETAMSRRRAKLRQAVKP